MDTAAQAKIPPPGVKPPVPKAFKGKKDDKIILSFIDQCKLYFSLVSMSIGFIWALFAVRLLYLVCYMVLFTGK